MERLRRLALPAVAALLAPLAATAAGTGESGSGPAKVSVGIDSVLAEDLSAAERKELRDSAEDVREEIRKRSFLELVERPDDAEIRVIVLGRRVDVGVSGETNFGGASTQRHYQSRHVLAFRLESDGSSHEGETVLAGAFVTWKRVAGALVKDVESWAREIREQR